MSGVKICTCQRIKDLTGKVVHVARACACELHPSKEQKMLSIDLDENGNPKSAIPIDAHATSYFQIFFEEMMEALVPSTATRVAPETRKEIFKVMEKAYRMGVARDHGEHRKVKESYDKMAQLTGKLVTAMLDVKDALTVKDAWAIAERVFALEPMDIAQINEQRASFAYGQLALTSSYQDATPEKLAELKAMCRKMAGCKP